jgi:predicted AAA+ superfamily ATPase
LVVEGCYRLHPEFRDGRRVSFFLDEIQMLAGCETFARRLIDTEHVELILSGSSARLLSREVATSTRGRAMEVLIYPFSFRESLRLAGAEPAKPWHRLTKAGRSTLDRRLRDDRLVGGFPEAQGVPPGDRANLCAPISM